MKRVVCFILWLVLCSTCASAHEQVMVLAAGGGYKKMVTALTRAYKEKTGKSVQLVFGNMGLVTGQARNSGAVDMVLGAHEFFAAAGVPMATVQTIGRGRLVFAWARGVSTGEQPLQELVHLAHRCICLPDTSRAIYGHAAKQFLQRSGYLPAVEKNLLVVATVPQVFSYLSLQEVDFGFLNLTHALHVQNALGGFAPVPDHYYDPIHIVAAILRDARHKKQADGFVLFLQSDEAQKIIRGNGL